MFPGGVDLKRYFPADDRKNLRHVFDIPIDKLILFSVRNLVPRMGLENLLYAFAKVADALPDTYLVIGGTGPLKNALIGLTKTLGLNERVRFTGFIPDEQLSSYYRMADIFILPTLELEGFGLVTLEAMATGLPVLGTPVGGTKEILDRFDSNFLFSDTSADSIADLIIRKYHLKKENPQAWDEICQSCHRFVEKYYSWDRNLDSLEDLYYSLLNLRHQSSSIKAF
jgi:glycosyltransferase involved in cell wall biosynthesis